MARLFYQPADAWAADFIPFYLDGRFCLFYLHDWRDREHFGEGTPWYQISTRDFIHFTEHGEMLARGAQDEQDLYVFTGSVMAGKDCYHIFYTGHNPYRRKQGLPDQGIMHAVSHDLLHWQKVPEDTFYAPTEQYEMHDWRDPFVFWQEEAEEYWMLLAARLKDGPSRRRGCTALCTSKDLKTWQVHPPLYKPGLYYTHECPDMFKIGDWWYLVFSEFSERIITRYRMSRSPRGPWLAPPEDSFDGRAFYAAKTWSDGQNRYVFGWNPTRDQQTDTGSWQWGGHLVVHALQQQPDGRLTVGMPRQIRQALKKTLPVAPGRMLGQWHTDGSRWSADAPDGFACLTAGPTPSSGILSASIRFTRPTQSGGIMLRASDDLEEAYYVRLEPARQRLVLDRWPRQGDQPHFVELERLAEFVPGQVHQLQVLIEDTVLIVYLDNRIAMSARLYSRKDGLWGFFVSEGAIQVEALEAATL